ncbi:MAG: class I SAM-dependent methyltransferase [Bacteroidetes bacterium]|nr:class I SAM-dependent methyltransferase [Bacteroidota bacterium]
MTIPRDFTTISPSAKSLLLMKGYTPIPFARQAAEWMLSPVPYEPDYSKKDVTFWARLVHFESRYRAVDQLLAGLDARNVLELSSGFSFRGLEAVQKSECHYIDTDLPEVITLKKEFITALRSDNEQPGKLELIALNALEEVNFLEVVSHFPGGEVTIVNEGLLMYLDTREKMKLCSIIRKVLEKRGGYWITADIYVKGRNEKAGLKLDKQTEAFFEYHRIEENKFDSFEDARAFFREMGFVVEAEASVNRKSISSMKYLFKNIGILKLLRLMKAGKIHASWRLKLA